jgi:peptidyl-tRNA hydrolase
VDAVLDALDNFHCERVSDWKDEHHGIKVCLSFEGTQHEFLELYQACVASGLPTVLVVDHGYTVFGGVHTVTAFGVGPAKRSEVQDILGHLSTKLPHERTSDDA